MARRPAPMRLPMLRTTPRNAPETPAPKTPNKSRRFRTNPEGSERPGPGFSGRLRFSIVQVQNVPRRASFGASPATAQSFRPGFRQKAVPFSRRRLRLRQARLCSCPEPPSLPGAFGRLRPSQTASCPAAFAESVFPTVSPKRAAPVWTGSLSAPIPSGRSHRVAVSIWSGRSRLECGDLADTSRKPQAGYLPEATGRIPVLGRMPVLGWFASSPPAPRTAPASSLCVFRTVCSFRSAFLSLYGAIIDYSLYQININ